VKQGHGDKYVSCARCGQKRKYTRKDVVLCCDCRYVLSEGEKELWSSKKVKAA
jgi:ribosomal protein S14